MVEFGLALPILLLVMYGLIESGRLLFIYASVVSAARQAVRYGSATGLNPAGVAYYNDCAGIRAAAKSLGFIQSFSDSNIQIRYDNGPDATNPWSQSTCPITSTQHPVNGDRIYVRVFTQYAPIVPLVPFEAFTIASAGWRTLVVDIPIAVDVPGISLPTGTSGALRIVKDAWCFACSPPGSYYELAGQTITYTYTISNIGSTDTVDVISLSDPHPNLSPISCPQAFPIVLGPSASVQCTATYVVTDADVLGDGVTAPSIQDTATVQGISNSYPLTAAASKTINFVPKPHLTLAKTGDVRTSVGKGMPVDYVYTLTNDGNTPLQGPAAINDPNLNSPAVCALGAGATLPIGGTTTCTGTHLLTQNDLNVRWVDNTAWATAYYNGFTVTSNSAYLRVLVPGLLLVMSSCNSAPPCAVGSMATVTGLNQTVYYTYWLTNRLSYLMYLAKVTDSRGASNFTCSAWNLIAAGATVSCSRSYSAYTQADMDNPLGQFLDTGTASASSGKPSNTATAAVNVTQTPQFTLTKTANVTQALSLPATITYTYKFTNTGNVTLGPPYSVSDDKTVPQGGCSGMTGTLAPGAYITCQRTYTVTQTDLDNGSIVNHATATATFTKSAGPLTVNSTPPPATATVWTYIGARLGLLKTPNTTVYGAESQQITYTFTLKNTGSVPLTGPYGVHDSLIGAISCPGATSPLPQGASTVCNTATYTISANDMLQPSVTNQAWATATATDTNTQITSVPNPIEATVYKFLCDSTHLTGTLTQPTASDLIWTIGNNTGQPLDISAISVSWSSGPPYLTTVLLNGATIWSGLSPSSGGFYLPTPPTQTWPLPSGNVPFEIRFTGSATAAKVVLTLKQQTCNPQTLTLSQ